LLVLANPVEGQDDEFNRWYSETHVPEVLKMSGFKTGQRFHLADEQMVPGTEPEQQYLASYEIEAPSAGSVLDAMKGGQGSLTPGTAMDRGSTRIMLFEALTEKRHSAG
jgi:hypothetical protein